MERKGQKIASSSVYNAPSQRFNRLLQKLKTKYKARDRHVIECLGTLIPEQGVILDIGAHLGGYAKEFARLYRGNVTVHCFEPSPYNLSILKEVVGNLNNVHINEFALSDKVGEVDLYLPIKKSGHLGTGLAHFGLEQARNYITERVQTVPLDSYTTENELSRLDFVKCDVEGAELLVLQGGVETIRRFHPTLYVEIGEDYLARMGHHAKDVFNFLRSVDYEPYQMDLKSCVPTRVNGYQGRAKNYLFKHRNSDQ